MRNPSRSWITEMKLNYLKLTFPKTQKYLFNPARGLLFNSNL